PPRSYCLNAAAEQEPAAARETWVGSIARPSGVDRTHDAPMSVDPRHAWVASTWAGSFFHGSGRRRSPQSTPARAMPATLSARMYDVGRMTSVSTVLAASPPITARASG